MKKYILLGLFAWSVVSASDIGYLTQQDIAEEPVQGTQVRDIAQLPTITLDSDSPFFKTSVISNPEQVIELLKERGFAPCSFMTDDGVTIAGLCRAVDNPAYSIVLSAGFFPGRMTGLSTFVELLDQNVNILFYDGRGKGGSSGLGKFLQVWRYGVDDHKDVQAAISFLHNAAPSAPVYVYGTCAGAFHSARALIQMSKDAETNPAIGTVVDNVNGLIFDSGWASVAETSSTALMSQADKSPFYVRYPVKAMLYTVLPMYNALYRWRYDNQTALYKQMAQVPCPVLFIHGKNDSFATIDRVRALMQSMLGQTIEGKRAIIFLWLLNKSAHAAHHLKHKNHYAVVLSDFIRLTTMLKDHFKTRPVDVWTYKSPEELELRRQPLAQQASPEDLVGGCLDLGVLRKVPSNLEMPRR